MPRTMSDDEFIERVRSIHGDRFDYSNVKYPGNKKKLLIIGSDGIVYNMYASALLRKDVPTINVAFNKNKAFEIQSRKIHGDKYDYSKVEYTTAQKHVTIICPIHGEFKQSPDRHFHSKGCRLCSNKLISSHFASNPTGWNLSGWISQSKISADFKSFSVYIIRVFNKNESFIKIGRTFMDLNKRFSCKNRLPYEYEIIKIFEGNPHHMFKLESKLKRECKNFRYSVGIPFNGKHECFTLDALELIKKYL